MPTFQLLFIDQTWPITKVILILSAVRKMGRVIFSLTGAHGAVDMGGLGTLYEREVGMAARNVAEKTLLAARAGYRAVLASLALCAHGAAAAAVPDMNPGSWEVTLQLESLESPVAMPPVIQTLCLTRQDVEAGGATLAPGALGQSAQCKPEQLEISEGNATWTLNCDGLSGQGRMSFSGDTYSGSADLTIGLAGEAQRLKQTFSGRRLGDCQK